MKRLTLGLVVAALIAGVMIPSVAFASTSQNVTVTGAPSFIAITNTPSTWTINGASDNGSGYILPATTYYSNPVLGTASPGATVNDTVCEFTVSNASATVPMTLTVTWSAFTGGDAMINTNTGSANATAYGAYCWYSGMTYSGKVVAKTAGSSLMKSSWSSATLKWGVEISTMTGAWTSGTAETSTITITATAT
jgi:hypothetical protein